MILNSVKIHNFKAISQMDIEFQPGVNLLIGDNGVGKTSALEAITVGLSAYFSGMAGIRARGITQKDIRFELPAIGDASATKKFFTPAEIECSAMVDGKQVQWRRSRKDERGNSKTSNHASDLSRMVQKVANEPDAVLPVISYQSTSRIASVRRGDYAAHMKKLNDRRAGYIGCIDDALDTKAINAWCLKMEMAEFRLKREIHEYEMFKAIVLQFMSEMEENNKRPWLSYDTNEDELVYGFEEEAYPISALSAGYQSILWIAMDLAYRNSILNPTMKDPKEINGIVLIDEIDMHLHPKWQWKIINALQKTFPAVQFILATHAPVIISSSKDAHLILIDEDHLVKYLPSAYAFAIDDVAELTQGSSGIPMELRLLSREFEKVFYADDRKAAEIIYRKMLEKFGENNTEVDLAKRRLSIM